VHWILIAATSELAARADAAGVDQVMVDLEVLGKAERQGAHDTHRSAHTVEHVEAFARTLKRAELLVRINPLGPHSRAEIAAVLDRGAQRVMLPMFSTPAEVDEFVWLVGGRTPVTLLVETPQALARLPLFIGRLKAGDLIHFGLNDLSLALGLGFPFEVLAGRLLDGAAAMCQRHGIAYGIGGIGRVGRGQLPAEIIMGELVRLDATWVILSRAFHHGIAPLEMELELSRLRAAEESFRATSPEALELNHLQLANIACKLGIGSATGERNDSEPSNRNSAGSERAPSV
jgi:hypothetical protein